MNKIKSLVIRLAQKVIYELTKNEMHQKKHAQLDDSYYLLDDVSAPTDFTHTKWLNNLVEIFNKPGVEILEIGSREVTGESNARKLFSEANYTGFDYHPGNNVDVVGDVHKLSTYFTKKFDLIYSASCFEHFAMPWIAATEMNNLLKVGGHIFIETHFSFRSHERPWNFFQFSDLGLELLFPSAMGYRCIDKGMSNPIVGRFSVYADEYLRYIPIKGLYCHSQFYAIKESEIKNFSWDKIELNKLVNNTEYPSETIMN
jgi:hypothetical protein